MYLWFGIRSIGLCIDGRRVQHIYYTNALHGTVLIFVTKNRWICIFLLDYRTVKFLTYSDFQPLEYTVHVAANILSESGAKKRPQAQEEKRPLMFYVGLIFWHNT